MRNSIESLSTISNFYAEELKTSPELRGFLKKEKICKWDSLLRLEVGYSSGELKNRLSENQIKRLSDLGILKTKGEEQMKDHLTIPLFDKRGDISNLFGKNIIDSSEKYLLSSEAGVMNTEAFKVYPDQMILTHTPWDALALLQIGFHNVSTFNGMDHLSPELITLLESNRVKRIVLALPKEINSEVQPESPLTSELRERGIEVKVLYPQGRVRNWAECLHLNITLDEVLKLIDSSTVLKSKRKKLDCEVSKSRGNYSFKFPHITYDLIGVRTKFVNNLRVNIKVKMENANFRDNVDLFSDRSRKTFIKSLCQKADVEMGLVELHLVHILDWLENERDSEGRPPVAVSDEDKNLALGLLTDPNLFNRIEKDLSSLGYIGERYNKQLMYIAATSRLLNDPISVIVCSESGAGKSHLIDTVRKLIPCEDVLAMTSLSDQSLNYLPESALLHKFLIMGEAVHNDKVEYLLREILSAKEITRLVAKKDEKTGLMGSSLVSKKAIVSTAMSTATREINPENASRCFVISADESENQTRAIHQEQRKKYSLERLQQKHVDIPKILATHHAAQRILKKYVIVNPYAEFLDFPDTLMRTRRDHGRFLDLIAAICHIRQFQKVVKKEGTYEYIQCDLEDYRIAYQILMHILPSTLSNFPKSALHLYRVISNLLQEKIDDPNIGIHDLSIKQREIREKAGLEHNYVKRNIRTLVEYDYLLQIGGNSRGGTAHYKLNKEAPFSMVDLTKIPTPDELEEVVQSEGYGLKV